MSTIVSDHLAAEAAVAAILSGDVDQTDHSHWDAPARRRASLALLARQTGPIADPMLWLSEVASRTASILSADHYAVGWRETEGQNLLFHWGAIAPDVLGDGSGQTELGLDPARSAAGYAFHQQRPIVLGDLADETRFRDPILAELGVTSGVVCCLGAGSSLSGVLGVFHRERRGLSEDEILYVENVAQMANTTLLRAQAEKLLSGQSRLLSSVMETTDCLMLELTGDGLTTRINSAATKLLGYDLTSLRSRPIWSAILMPEEVPLIKQGFDRVRKGETPVRLESYVLTKAGDRFRISWSLGALLDERGGVSAIVATGVNISEQAVLAQKLERAEATTAQAKKALVSLREQIEKSQAMLASRETPQPPRVERRDARRRPFPHIQIVAPMHGEQLPSPHQFSEIRCFDISPKGFSFLSPNRFDHPRVLIGFGPAPSHLYLVADVVHVTPYVHAGRAVYLVGCKYYNRVNYGGTRA